MRLNYVLASLLLVSAAHAKEPKHYQSGKLVKMESVKCGVDEKDGNSIAAEVIGTDSTHRKTRELLCQQYVLEADNLVYTIQPKTDKHPALLPIGERAQFRIAKDKMMLCVEDRDEKEREYIVVAVVPKSIANYSNSESVTAAK